MRLGKSWGRPRSDRVRRGRRRFSNPHDFYPTPAYVTEGLLERERFSGTILEPACGQGHMASVLRAYGYEVEAKDIQNGHDFLLRHGPVPNVVTNPPYSHPSLEKFVRHALQIATGKAAFLVPFWFLEARCRQDLLQCGDFPLAAIYPLIDRPKFIEGKRCPYPVLWLVWERGHFGPPRSGVIVGHQENDGHVTRRPQILSFHDIASPQREKTMSSDNERTKTKKEIAWEACEAGMTGLRQILGYARSKYGVAINDSTVYAVLREYREAKAGGAAKPGKNGPPPVSFGAQKPPAETVGFSKAVRAAVEPDAPVTEPEIDLALSLSPQFGGLVRHKEVVDAAYRLYTKMAG
jgi:hypothetical protein